MRLFAYGSLSLVLVFYLTGLGLTTSQTGVLFTLTLIGDTVISLYLTTRADRIGRRRMLIVGALLMIAAGLIFAITHSFLLLTIAATIGAKWIEPRRADEFASAYFQIRMLEYGPRTFNRALSLPRWYILPKEN